MSQSTTSNRRTTGQDRASRHSEASGRWLQVLDRFSHHPSFTRLIDNLATAEPEGATVTGLAGSAQAVFLRALTEATGRPLLMVTERPDEANDLYDDLRFLLGDTRVGHYPARQILPYDFRAPAGEIMGRRISSLAGLNDKELSVVVLSVASLAGTNPHG